MCCLGHVELAWLFQEPHAGLDHCLRMLQACFRKRMSESGRAALDRRATATGHPVAGFVSHSIARSAAKGVKVINSALNIEGRKEQGSARRKLVLKGERERESPRPRPPPLSISSFSLISPRRNRGSSAFRPLGGFHL